MSANVEIPEIPKNIIEYLSNHNGCNLQVNLNHADADYGYAHRLLISVVISHLTRTCNRCGFDVIWNPDDTESKCGRHTYGAYRYDEVFAWSPLKCSMTLEEAFNDWLISQSKDYRKPIVLKTYGEFQ